MTDSDARQTGADADHLAALVRQHAMTSSLLGVPFVPSYRGGGAGGVIEPAADQSRATDAPAGRPVGAAAKDIADSAAGSASGSGSGSASGSGSGLDSAADLLEALRLRYIAEAPHANFETAHTSIVFGEGDPQARLMFVGEAPGADEDKAGRPFVGKSGQLLDKMIVAMGLSRASVYIANVLKTRPPGNRTPTLDEARACAPYLYEQIRIVSPEVIVTLGKSAGQLLLGTEANMGAMRGQWAAFPPESPLIPIDAGFPSIAVMPTYHPAYLLRSYTPENRAMVWGDLKLVMDRLGLGA